MKIQNYKGKKMKNQIILTMAICGIMATALNARTIYVSQEGSDIEKKKAITTENVYGSKFAPAKTIQAAVNIAKPGDKVLVGAGIYSNKVSEAYGACMLKVDSAITVQSESGPYNTVIDGGEDTRCVFAQNGAVVAGFTLINGGTMGSSQSSNWKLKTGAGGLAIDGGIISNCIAVNCKAFTGAGFSCNNEGIIIDCIALTNTADMEGGGFLATEGGKLIRCIGTENVAIFGGGANVLGAEVDACRFTGNSAVYGGGIVNGPGSILKNSVIDNNRAADDGGGIVIEGGAKTINCTIARNYAYRGKQVFMLSKGEIANSIIYGGSVDETGSYYFPENDKKRTYSGDVHNSRLAPVYPGRGNVNLPPSFVNPSAGDYQLLDYSLCINAGDNDSINNDTDMNGNPRVHAGEVDLGAYENQNIEVASLDAIGKIKAKVNLKWNAVSKDKISFAGEFKAPAPIKLSKDSVYLVSIGNKVISSSDLELKKVSSNGRKIKYISAKGETPKVSLAVSLDKIGVQTKIAGKIQNDDLSNEFTSYGIENVTTGKEGEAKSIPTKMIVANIHTENIASEMNYKSKQDKKGNLKSKK